MVIAELESKLARSADLLERFAWLGYDGGDRQAIAKEFADLARRMVLTMPESGATRSALEALLVAQKAAIEAVG